MTVKIKNFFFLMIIKIIVVWLSKFCTLIVLAVYSSVEIYVEILKYQSPKVYFFLKQYTDNSFEKKKNNCLKSRFNSRSFVPILLIGKK